MTAVYLIASYREDARRELSDPTLTTKTIERRKILLSASSGGKKRDGKYNAVESRGRLISLHEPLSASVHQISSLVQLLQTDDTNAVNHNTWDSRNSFQPSCQCLRQTTRLMHSIMQLRKLCTCPALYYTDLKHCGYCTDGEVRGKCLKLLLIEITAMSKVRANLKQTLTFNSQQMSYYDNTRSWIYRHITKHIFCNYAEHWIMFSRDKLILRKKKWF